MQQPRFVIYSRSYCHLCDDMKEALLATFGLAADQVEMIDVDADATLEAQYDELVPVLMGRGADGGLTRLCHYFLDPAAVQDFVQSSAHDAGAGSR
ncbi:glutaredoxin family protein [Herbaspirillum sp. alder98]|uniref:glutaredoxin family protein n=1 Tax=Herbaspirillum sp. alder98 TaxID=2913096 RepID=UPI001CD8E6A6|nr:glutaredoxin family protein [Herbaspirillum sp. alder98]MCA1322714.1 glutaredoxin family protein [Herbaspirillum sp. alder98]